MCRGGSYLQLSGRIRTLRHRRSDDIAKWVAVETPLKSIVSSSSLSPSRLFQATRPISNSNGSCTQTVWQYVPGEPKKIPPTTFIDITAMHGNFCTKFYTIVKRSNIHFITSFIEIFLELTKLRSFNHGNPHFTVFVSMFIRMSIQCSLKFEITSITKERHYWRQ